MERRVNPKSQPQSHDLLRVKYLQLARKYAALVARSEQFGGVSGDPVASASGRLAAVAAALIENGVVFHASARWTQIVPKELLPRLLARIQPRKVQGMSVHELRVAGRAGAKLVVRLEVSGGLTLAVASEEAQTWATDNPESRARLWRAERLRVLGQLAAGVAHDLSSTLRSIRYLLASIENDDVVRRQCGKVLDSMARGLEDSSLVVGRLHHFARTGDQPLQAVRLEAVIAEAVRLAQMNARPDAKVSRIAVRLRNLPPVQGSPGELVHVFLNLLRNGMEAGGGVSVSGARLGDWLRVVVADHGTGIAPGNLGRIFEPFFTTKGDKGSGLGLFIASTLLQRMGGTIGVANRSGGGALFSVELPVVSSASPAAKPSAAAPPGARRPKRALRNGRRPSPA